MPERRARTALIERRNRACMRDMPQSDDCPQIGHLTYGGFQEAPTGPDLFRCRLVFRRNAAHRVGYSGIDEHQPIVRTRPVIARREPKVLERVVKEIAGKITGEWPTRSIGAAQSRCKADDQKGSGCGAKRRNRRVEPARLPLAPLISELFEART